MDWKKIALSVGTAIVACLTTHGAVNGSVAAALSKDALAGAAVCVVIALYNLFQDPPKTTPAKTPRAPAA